MDITFHDLIYLQSEKLEILSAVRSIAPSVGGNAKKEISQQFKKENKSRQNSPFTSCMY